MDWNHRKWIHRAKGENRSPAVREHDDTSLLVEGRKKEKQEIPFQWQNHISVATRHIASSWPHQTDALSYRPHSRMIARYLYRSQSRRVYQELEAGRNTMENKVRDWERETWGSIRFYNLADHPFSLLLVLSVLLYVYVCLNYGASLVTLLRVARPWATSRVYTCPRNTLPPSPGWRGLYTHESRRGKPTCRDNLHGKCLRLSPNDPDLCALSSGTRAS